MGKSLVSGQDFPLVVNPLNQPSVICRGLRETHADTPPSRSLETPGCGMNILSTTFSAAWRKDDPFLLGFIVVQFHPGMIKIYVHQ